MHNNQFLIMGLFSFLSFFGCSGKNVTTVTHGPFTIQCVKKTYKTFNMNNGWVNASHGEFHILYKGKPITFSNNLQNNTGFSHLWQVYILEGAPYPTLIAGSQSLYLITEENGTVQSRPLVEQGSDFASLQYLDAAGGQPAASSMVFMSDGDDTISSLKGGDYLMVSQHAVLHVPDLKLYPFNHNNNPVDNYSFQSDQGAISFSPDHKKIVFTGSFQTWNTNETPKYELSMIVYDFKNDTGVSVPFSKTRTRLKDQSFTSSHWFNTYFEWKKSANGDYHLQLTDLKELPRWQGFMRDKGKIYELSPVSIEMQQALADFMLQKWGLTRDSILPGGEYSTDAINIAYNGLKFELWYRATDKELFFMKNSSMPEDDRYMPLINEISTAFNAALKEGRYQELFTNWSD